MCGCLLHVPYWGPGLKLRYMPWLEIKPATLWFTGQWSVHWATPARAIHDNLIQWPISPNWHHRYLSLYLSYIVLKDVHLLTWVLKHSQIELLPQMPLEKYDSLGQWIFLLRRKVSLPVPSLGFKHWSHSDWYVKLF